MNVLVRLAFLIPILLFLTLFSCQKKQRPAVSNPNIVLIVADDLGYGDIGCYGSEINKTPHIDALAGTGLRFTDFHSAGPMCTPTRAAMLTGLYQQRFGRLFDGPLNGLEDRETGLPLEAVTIAEVLKRRGYITACFGKWHLGFQPPWLPPDQGFDEFRGLGSGDGDHHTQINRWGREDWWYNNKIEMTEGYTAELLTQYSVDFIERHCDEPFFLYVPHLAIHFPWQGPDDPPHRQKGQNYKNDKWGIIPDRGNVSPHVKAMVESVDKSVGEIVAALDRSKLRDNTLLVFTSDNGGYLTYGSDFKNISSNGPLRDQKGSIYEGGHRVPMIISWPGVVSAEETGDVAHSIDLMPTFAALAGITTEDLSFDGIDLSPKLLRGERLPDRQLFWRAGSDRAVRSGPWKLCVAENGTELFNLNRDLGEKNDISVQEPGLVKKLVHDWEDWEKGVNQSAAVFKQDK